jgi:hypothetical protein
MSPPEPQPSAASPPKPARQPALLYILAAFGIVAGGYGSFNAVQSIALLLKPQEVFVESYVETARLLDTTASAKQSEHANRALGEATYERRKAALPLAAVAVIVSCLLFGGCIRAMMGDRSGLGMWALAATAGIPHQLLWLAFGLLTLRDLGHAAELAAYVHLWRLGMLLSCALAVGYYAASLVFLRAWTGRPVDQRRRT